MVYDAAEATAGDVEVETFLVAYRHLADALHWDMTRHELFRHVPASERLFLGTAVEYFQLIRDAENHVKLALGAAQTPKQRELLQQYLDDEREHWSELWATLQPALGQESLCPEDLRPLAATDAVLLKRRELARTSPLAYLAALSFAESRFDAMLTTTPTGWSSPALQLLGAYDRHAREDAGLAHRCMLVELIRAEGRQRIDSVTATQTLVAVHEFKHYLDNLNAEILRVYGTPNAQLPRIRHILGDFV